MPYQNSPTTRVLHTLSAQLYVIEHCGSSYYLSVNSFTKYNTITMTNYDNLDRLEFE